MAGLDIRRQEMLARQPYLPRFMAGGPGNPLGARAMYLGGSVYRIHGTNAPPTIGQRVSSGCIRLTNEDVDDLYSRVKVGTKVVVLPMSGSRDREPVTVSARIHPLYLRIAFQTSATCVRRRPPPAAGANFFKSSSLVLEADRRAPGRNPIRHGTSAGFAS